MIQDGIAEEEIKKNLIQMKSYEEKINFLIEKFSLDSYITFTADCHLNEYIGPEDKRVAELTNFTGSNGTAITASKPALITDSRYYLQAQSQSKYPLFMGNISQYLSQNNYKRVSFDTRMISSQRFKILIEKFTPLGISFVSTELYENIKRPISKLINLENIFLKDFINDLNSGLPNEKLISYLNSFVSIDFNQNVTGSYSKDKIEKLRQKIGNKKLLISELDTIAWVLNLRASDIEYNPVFYAYMILDQSSLTIFTDHEMEIPTKKYNEFEEVLNTIKDEEILISGDCNQNIFSQLSNASFTNMVLDLQTTKNHVEMIGMILSYFYDGVALCNIFGYLHNRKFISEKDVADKLHDIKTKFPGYFGPSFATISASGENAAIVHHESSENTIDYDKVFLLDSGSHYYFGTTDTTRTLFFGENIPGDLKHDYTLVFKGHIDAMKYKYASGSKYKKIDELARVHLKNESKDFGHATGHGVGHFLYVHERPPAINYIEDSEIESGKVFSIEPGFYKDNFYGIRIENLVCSKKEGGNLLLDNITMVPYQARICELEMLSKEEKEFLNGFNEKCYNLLKEYVDEYGLKFLEENTIRIN